ncbi:MAG TPA: DNA-directed RNA polymerase subunit alpha, partial [Trueperaceae bacterium]|nr:DNA-directed RNA polymerase subunit alpha [Trueperaceae bacterium]
IVNPELHIATLTPKGKLVMEVRVEPGIGYVPAEIHNTKDRINSIPVSAIYTPVKRVAYRVEDTRVGQKTDWDRLVLEVWTDGSINPKEALSSAVKIMREQLTVFGTEMQSEDQADDLDDQAGVEAQEFDAGPAAHISLDNLNLSSRVLHSLQEEGIDSVNALLALSRNDLKKVGGVGEKSLREIEETLGSQGFKLKE